MFGWLNNSPRYPATDQWGLDYDDPNSFMGGLLPGRGGPSSTQGGGMGLGPWMALSAGMSLIGGMQQARAMQNAAATTAASNMQMANVAAGAQKDVGKGNIAQGMAQRTAQYGWGADLDFDRQRVANTWEKTRGADLDLAADYNRKKQGFALLNDRDYRASERRKREHEIRKEKARSQAAMSGMFGPISGGFG